MAELIIQHLEERNGKVYFAGTNIKAKLVANMHVNGGDSIETVMQHYSLSQAQVHAALAHYYDHREQIEAEFEQAKRTSWSGEQKLEELRKRK